MQERVSRAQTLFHVGLFVMLASAIASATIWPGGRSGITAFLTAGGAVLALGARLWLSQLQRSIQQGDTRPGVWAAR